MLPCSMMTRATDFAGASSAFRWGASDNVEFGTSHMSIVDRDGNAVSMTTTIDRSPNVAPYRDASLPAEQRVADLLARMTIEEKAAQMMCVWQQKAETLVDANGAFDVEKARRAFGHGNGLGQVVPMRVL